MLLLSSRTLPVTAKPFFEQRGYVTVREKQVMRKGILLTNFVMEKNKER